MRRRQQTYPPRHHGPDKNEQESQPGILNARTTVFELVMRQEVRGAKASVVIASPYPLSQPHLARLVILCSMELTAGEIADFCSKVLAHLVVTAQLVEGDMPPIPWQDDLRPD
jgi:hypothetical protein